MAVTGREEMKRSVPRKDIILFEDAVHITCRSIQRCVSILTAKRRRTELHIRKR